MRKLFISQPMRGKTDEEIKLERERAIEHAERLAGEQFEVIDSFFEDMPIDEGPLWYLGESIKLLGDADMVYFAPGWKEARGCLVEHQVSVNYNIPIIMD